MASTTTAKPNVVTGKVVVRELNVGVPDLVVTVYDVDPADEDRYQILRRLSEVLGVGNSGTPIEDFLQWWDSLGWDRLGSVLTRRDGTFHLEFDDDLFRRRDPEEARPDYVLFVLAPEDPIRHGPYGPYNAHPVPRMLHFSWVTRRGAGRIESSLIRLAQKELDDRGIPYGSARPVDHGSAVSAAKVKLNAAKVAREEFKAVTTESREGLSAIAGKSQGLLGRLFLEQPLPTGRLFALEPSDRVTLQREVANEGLARLAGNLRLDLGRAAPGGTSVDAGQANEVLRTRRDESDLTRTRSLLDACLARKELRRLLAETHHHDGGGSDPSEPGGENEVTLDEAQQLLLSRTIGQIADLPSAQSRSLLEKLRSSKRSDPSTLAARLDALELRGGPADAVAYHDFYSLQIAFRSVWRRVFDDGLRARGEELYERWVAVREFAGLGEPTEEALRELNSLAGFVAQVQRDMSLAAGIAQRTGTLPDWDGAASPWESFVSSFLPPMPPIPGVAPGGPPPPPSPRDAVGALLGDLMGLFGGAGGGSGGRADGGAGARRVAPPPPASHLLGRLHGLTLDLAKRLSENYQFDVFEPGTYNFGVLTQYRQRWEPLNYQVGELVASLPLAPGEKRKVTAKQVVKLRRDETRTEASSSASRFESADTARADVEIINRATTTTNFSQSAQADLGFGEMLKLTTTTQFSNNQQRHSEQKKRDFRESVRKAADEYKRERKLEIKQTDELESTSEEVREISNPNTEITVTYLFYELQRRFKVSEQLHRARPVILVAQDVPAPDKIDEGFLVAHEWILRRVLLDPSFLPALDALTTELPGDELSVAVLRSAFERNLQVVDQISGHLQARSALRDQVRSRVLELLQGVAPDETGTDVAAAIFSGGLSLLFGGGGGTAGADLEAAREAADRELEYTESELAETERRLKQAMSALEESTQKYVEALRAQLNRRTAIDQLRVHVKQNILYYMQAIWNHEPADQRFFRLYDLPIDWFELEAPADSPPAPVREEPRTSGTSDTGSLMSLLFGVGGTRFVADFAASLIRLRPEARRLGEVADLDALLGFKGNYMIFPLKETNALTEYMMQDYRADEVMGLLDPDDFANYTNEELAAAIRCAREEDALSDEQLAAAEELLLKRLIQTRRDSEEIIVPTGQLFIEALPGEHALLEDFKLVHRQLDAEKVDAEVRIAYLEALRVANRLTIGELGDPNVDRLIRISGNADVDVDADG